MVKITTKSGTEYIPTCVHVERSLKECAQAQGINLSKVFRKALEKELADSRRSGCSDVILESADDTQTSEEVLE